MVTRTEISQRKLVITFQSSVGLRVKGLGSICHSVPGYYLHIFISFDKSYTSLNCGDSSHASQDEIQIFFFWFTKLFQSLFIKMNQNDGLWLKAQPDL